MTNQELVNKGNSMMDDTDQAIERGKKVTTAFTYYLYIIVPRLFAIAKENSHFLFFFLLWL